MFKALFWLAWDVLCIYASATLWNESGGEINGYLILCVACVVWFTWELIHTIIELFK